MPVLTCLPHAGLSQHGNPDLGLGAPPQVGAEELDGAVARRRHPGDRCGGINLAPPFSAVAPLGSTTRILGKM